MASALRALIPLAPELDQVFGHFQQLQPEIYPAKKELAKNIISQKSYNKINKLYLDSFEGGIQQIMLHGLSLHSPCEL